MRKNVLVYTSAALLMMAANLMAVEVDVDDAAPGKWTMDLDAAKKVAAEKKLPIMINFTGSDWCGWCKLMEESVFSKPEWQAYATNNVMLVFVDFPQDKSLVPEKYVDRNKTLSDAYWIEGFPTFVILDDDGTTELGRLSAERDITPGSFIADLKVLFRSRKAAVSEFMESLNPEQKAAYAELVASREEVNQQIAEQKQLMMTAQAKAEELQQSISGIEEKMLAIRLTQLSEDELATYNELKVKFEATEKKLKDWIATDPEHNEENIKLYQEMATELQALQEALSKY